MLCKTVLPCTLDTTSIQSLPIAVMSCRRVVKPARQLSCAKEIHAQWRCIPSPLHLLWAVWCFVCLAVAWVEWRRDGREWERSLRLPSGQAMAGHTERYTARSRCGGDGMHCHCAWISVVQEGCLAGFYNSSIGWFSWHRLRKAVEKNWIGCLAVDVCVFCGSLCVLGPYAKLTAKLRFLC